MASEIEIILDTCERLIQEARDKLYPPNIDYPLSIVLPEDIANGIKRFLIGHIPSPWVTPDISNSSVGTLFGARFLTSKIIQSPIVF